MDCPTALSWMDWGSYAGLAMSLAVSFLTGRILVRVERDRRKLQRALDRVERLCQCDADMIATAYPPTVRYLGHYD